METNKKKLLVDIILFIDFIILAFSGFVLKKVYPAGENSGRAGVLFLFDRFQWLKIHDITAILIIVFLLIHLFLNWNWIKCMVKGLFKSKTNNNLENGNK